jgi:formate dehydrogenase gamma subunit
MYSKLLTPILVFAHLAVNTHLSPQASAQEPPPQSCTPCHDRRAQETPYGPPGKLLAESVHSSLDCTDCHESASLEGLDPAASNPHPEPMAPVDCGQCHEDEVEAYTKHGRLEVGKDPDIPSCWNCHGTHDIYPSSDRQSHVHPVNLASTCRFCHADVDLVRKHDILRDQPIKLYESSVHGRASKKGIYVAATCNDCHAARGPDGRFTTHRILTPADPSSPIFHFNIPDTCGRCHKAVTRDYLEGIHGQRVTQGSVDAPVCTHCHGEHGIISPKDPRSPVSAARLAESTCSPCHESQILNEKYGIPAGRLRSYVDSYHGLKSKAGDVHVANCASCHGAHRILPSSDPTSSINPKNVRETCGECHPDITPALATTSIHDTATGVRTGWPHFFTVLYIWIIVVTIGIMLLHNAADWWRQIRRTARKTFVIRMNVSETAQHWVLMISFIVLVVSGFSLRFSESWWVEVLFGWGGGKGFLFRGTIHRVAAVVFLCWAFWHAIYLCTARGRRWFRDMLAGKRDLTDIKENILFFLGARDTEPQFGRFSYMEKCEYWALIWGTLIMAVTGILLWFDNYFVERWHLPKDVLEVAMVIHYCEAWLAALAILVWHIYGVIFRPSVYPMNTAWWAGRMPKEMYLHEHPRGPRLKARTYVVHYEDEEEWSLDEQGPPGKTPHSQPSLTPKRSRSRSLPGAAPPIDWVGRRLAHVRRGRRPVSAPPRTGPR